MRHPTDAVFNVAGGTKRVPMTTCQPINRCTLSKVTSSARDSPRTTRPVHAVSTAFPAGPPVHGRTGSSRWFCPDRFGDDVLHWLRDVAVARACHPHRLPGLHLSSLSNHVRAPVSATPTATRRTARQRRVMSGCTEPACPRSACL